MPLGLAVGACAGALVATGVASPRQWLWMGLGVGALVGGLWEYALIPEGISEEWPHLEMVAAWIAGTCLMGGFLGAAAVHAVRARRERAVAGRAA